MAKRITDDDLKIRHSVLHVLLAALGYISDDSSPATIWEVQRRFDEAVAAGRMSHESWGHYAVMRTYYDQQVQKNSAQQRSAA